MSTTGSPSHDSAQKASAKRPRSWGRDLLAGLVDAVVALPDGLATAALVGVNPVYGLYANAIGPTVGGVLSSSQLMVVATTSASAVTAAEALSPYAPEQRSGALMLLVVLTGAFLLLFGVSCCLRPPMSRSGCWFVALTDR